MSTIEGLSRWIASSTKRAVACGAMAAALALVGCGAYQPEPSFPEPYEYVAPNPPTAAELAAEQKAREEAVAASREILIGAEENEYSDTDPSAVTEFRPALEGYGTWVDDASYGTVWVPSKEEVGEDFQPYLTAGHWTYSEATDYVWVSDYSWGWAPFHYGRWVYLPDHGWAWIAGRRYAGAWVTWRVGPAAYGYLGWAPAPPSWYWHDGVAYGWSFGWYRHRDYYVYCPRHRIYDPTVSTHVVRGTAAREHDGRTQDYVPARPVVSGDDARVVANPSVSGGDRIIARPAVGASRIPASPGVGSRGPRPEELGLEADAVVAPPASNQGLRRAQVLARPSTAVSAGASPPAHLRPREAFAGEHRPSPIDRSTASAASSPSFVPSSPSYRSTAPAYRSSPSVASSYRTTAPTMRASPRILSSYRSSPPSVRQSPSFGSSSRSFRSAAPAVRTAPSFRSSSPPSRSSAPAVRSGRGLRRR